MGIKIIYTITYILFFFSATVFADTIYLKSGSKVTGIITKEDDESIGIKINIGAVVTFSKKDVERIERDADAERNKLEERWEAEKAKRGTETIEDVTFEQEQKEKGLVKYKDIWVTTEEKERIIAADIASDFDKGHSEKRFSSKNDTEERSSFAKKLLVKGNWFVRETEHFSIFYRDITQAKIVSDKAEYYFEKIIYDFGYENDIKWDKKCQVYIVESPDKWKDFLKDIGFNPDLVGGFVPNYAQKEMYLCSLSEGYLAVTFPHELTHLIFKDIAGNNTIPLWLNEGLANYEASVTSISNDILIKHIKHGEQILLGDLLRITTYPEGKNLRELFYAQSEKLVEFLITQYGRKKFRKFCELILRDKSFNNALFIPYKEDFVNLEDFNIKWVEYIVK